MSKRRIFLLLFFPFLCIELLIYVQNTYPSFLQGFPPVYTVARFCNYHPQIRDFCLWWAEFDLSFKNRFQLYKYLTICLMLAIDQIVFSIERQFHNFWIKFDKLAIVLASWSSTTADLEQQQFTQCGISPLLSLIKFEIFVRILKQWVLQIAELYCD